MLEQVKWEHSVFSNHFKVFANTDIKISKPVLEHTQVMEVKGLHHLRTLEVCAPLFPKARAAPHRSASNQF